MKSLIETAKRNLPKPYGETASLGAWDLGVAGLLIPASVTLVESLGHDVMGVNIPHGISTFCGTLLGCIVTVWFARRFRPQ